MSLSALLHCLAPQTVSLRLLPLLHFLSHSQFASAAVFASMALIAASAFGAAFASVLYGAFALVLHQSQTSLAAAVQNGFTDIKRGVICVGGKDGHVGTMGYTFA